MLQLTIVRPILLCLLFSQFLVVGCNQTNNSQNRELVTEKKGNPIIDSSTISRWDVYPADQKEIRFSVFKDSGVFWKVSFGNQKNFDADPRIVNRSLKHFSDFKNMNPANLNKTLWSQKGIDDKGTKIVVYVLNHKTDSFRISKMEFNPQNKSSYYIRREGTDSVYLLSPDYLEGSIVAKGTSFRKREMVPLNTALYKTIRIVLPGTDSYYLIEKLHNNQWSINGQEADQKKVNGYLRILSMIQIPEFATGTIKTHPDASITIKSDLGDIVLSVYKNETDNKWIMASSVNIGNLLNLNNEQINALFLPSSFFMPKEK